VAGLGLTLVGAWFVNRSPGNWGHLNWRGARVAAVALEQRCECPLQCSAVSPSVNSFDALTILPLSCCFFCLNVQHGNDYKGALLMSLEQIEVDSGKIPVWSGW